MYLVVILFALFASLFTLGKLTLEYSEPFFMIGSRMTFAGIILLGYHLFIAKRKIAFKREHLKPLTLLTVLNIYIANITEVWGLQHMPSAKACLIFSLSPFIAALMAYLVLGEKLNQKKWLGMFVGLLGLVPIYFTQTAAEHASGSLGFFTLAEVSLIIAVFCSVYGWIILKKLITVHEFPLIAANGISMAIGGVLALAHSYLSGESWSPIPVNQIAPFIQNSLLMCLISNIICYNLYGLLLKRFSATFMSFAGLVTPLFASLFGWLFLKEQVTWHFFSSIVMFSIGLAIFYQEELRQEIALQANS